MVTVGIISDTHGLLRPEAAAALRGCDHLIHGGDIGSLDVVEQLRKLAPLSIIRGNIDKADWAQQFPETTTVDVAGKRVYVLHSLKELRFDPAAEGYHVVVSGHSHKPAIHEEGGVLYVNPGSAGPRRFKLPISVAKLAIDEEGVKASIQALSIQK